MQSASQSQSAPSDAVGDWLHAVSALGLRVQLRMPQRARTPDQQTGSQAEVCYSPQTSLLLILTRLSLVPWAVCMYVGAAGVKLGSTAWTKELTALQLFLQFPYVCHTGLEPQVRRQGPRQACNSRVRASALDRSTAACPG